MLVCPRDRLPFVATNTKGLSPERADAARDFVRKAIARRGVKENAYAIALRFSQSQVNAFLNGKTAGGLALIEHVADYERVSIDAVVGRGDAARPVATSAPDRAHQAALLLGYSADVIATGLSSAAPNEDARAVLRRIAVAELAPPVAANVVVSALTVMKDAPEGGHDVELAKLDKDKRKPKSGG